jgi:hypothetical protein
MDEENVGLTKEKLEKFLKYDLPALQLEEAQRKRILRKKKSNYMLNFFSKFKLTPIRVNPDSLKEKKTCLVIFKEGRSYLLTEDPIIIQKTIKTKIENL